MKAADNKRYTTRAAFVVDHGDDEFSATADQIIVDEDLQQTGLVDQNGVPLYRVRERVKFGFVS